MQTEQLMEKIRSRAYEIWEQEGHPNGRDFNNWVAAEAECYLESLQSTATNKPAPVVEITDKT